MIAINLSKQKALDIDPKIIKQINFTGNLDRTWNTKIFIIIEEVKYTILDISRGTVRVNSDFIVTGSTPIFNTLTLKNW